jgi:hypothetical protein
MRFLVGALERMRAVRDQGYVYVDAPGVEGEEEEEVGPTVAAVVSDRIFALRRSVVAGVRALVFGGVGAAQAAVNAVNNNTWGVADAIVLVGTAAYVANDRVGYIRSYIDNQQELHRQCAARSLAEDRAARDEVIAVRAGINECVRNAAIMAAAAITLTRFARRAPFVAAIVNRRPGEDLFHRLFGKLDRQGNPVGGALFETTDIINGAIQDNMPRIKIGCENRPPFPRVTGETGAPPAVDGVPPGPPPPPGGGPTGESGQKAKEASPQQTSVFKRGPLFSGRCEWKDRMEDDERAAEGLAQFLSVGTNGEADVAYLSGQSFWRRLMNRWYVSHKSYHRASNKFCKRMKLLRNLREDMIYTGVGHKRERTNLNLAAAEELAKKVALRAMH